MTHRNLLVAAGILGATGVALGAFGAHGLRTILVERGTKELWETATHYHLLHAVALMALVAPLHQTTATLARSAGRIGLCWIAGTLLFSGSIYALALGGPRWLGPVTPLGGLALIAGWVLVIAAALRKNA